jgi:integrase
VVIRKVKQYIKRFIFDLPLEHLVFRPSKELISIHNSLESMPGVQEFLSSKARGSIHGNIGYKTSLAYLHQFVGAKYSGMTLENIISSFESKVYDVYKFLDEFVSFLETKNISKSTIHQYMSDVKSYIQYHDIDIVPYKFKRRVTLPKILRDDERAIDQDDIRTILNQCRSYRLKTYLLVLASSGARAIEACALRIRDINFDTPTGIHIRKEYTKTKRSRDIYISDEASLYLKEWIKQRFDIDLSKTKKVDERIGDCLVFQVQEVNVRKVNPLVTYTKFIEQFHKVLDSANLGQRKDGTPTRRQITLHSFRRFVKTTISDSTAGSDYSEWFLGHTKSSYWVKKPEARALTYKEHCMPYLTFLDYSALRAAGKTNESRINKLEEEKQIMGQKHREESQKHEEEMKVLHERMDRMERIMKLIEYNPKLARAKRPALERLANTR